MGQLDRIYSRLPKLAQHAAVSTYGVYWHWLRFGPGYKRYVSEYRQRDRFTPEQWREWQQERLRQVLQAATNVPYYQQTWNQRQKRAALAGRLEELPLLGKEPLRSEPKAFLRQDVKTRGSLIFHTSGSTGTPIATYWTRGELRRSLAVREVRSAGWAQVSFRMPRATFSGRIVEPDPESTGPFYRYNLAESQVYLSAFHLRPDTAAAYVEGLRRHGVKWLTGYAVSYYLLARLILEQKIKVPPLEAVITTSEKVTPEMRTVMQAAYGCRVYEEYSTVENVIFASECEEGRLHLSPDVAVVEILKSDGTPSGPDEEGEVVATCLLRDYQPLIRFRLGDVATLASDSCACGRPMPVLKEVVGRIEDVVVGPDGRQMVRFHGLFVNQPQVREGQVIQETLACIRVKIVPADEFNNTTAKEIVQRVQQRLGSAVQVIIEPVNQIPRTAAGKFPAVISLLTAQQSSKEAVFRGEQ
jgi:phenylacetate-CoA ligase